MNEYRYSIRCGWGGLVESPSKLSEKYLKTIRTLAQPGSVFDPWYIFDVRAGRQILLSEADDELASAIKNNVVRDDNDEPEPIYGYHILGRNDLETTPRTISLNVDGGGKLSNEALFQNRRLQGTIGHVARHICAFQISPADDGARMGR